MAVLARIVSIAAIVAAVGVLLPARALPADTRRARPWWRSNPDVLVQLNQIRVAHGLVPLELNRSLSAAAGQHTTEMLRDGYFAHNSADGSAFWKRIERYYPSAQYHVWSVGENLLWSSGGLDANAALALWMASPEHRANILSPTWREIGISALAENDAPGAFGGNSVTLVATDFGART